MGSAQSRNHAQASGEAAKDGTPYVDTKVKTKAEESEHVMIYEVVNNHRMHVDMAIKKDSKMDRSELRSLYESAPDDLFNAAYKMFDWSLTGKDALMNARMFSMIMVTFLAPKKAMSDASLFDVAFSIFDVDNSGSLDKAEFTTMLKVMYSTRKSALTLIFESGSGHDMLRDFAVKEHAGENIEFLDAVKAFEKCPDGACAKKIISQFIGENSETQVNISAKCCRNIMKAYEEAGGDDAVGMKADMFEAAKKEITKMVEKDTFNRFNQDDNIQHELAERLYNEIDVKQTGFIDREEYIIWAKNNPEAIKFYENLKNVAPKSPRES